MDEKEAFVLFPLSFCLPDISLIPQEIAPMSPLMKLLGFESSIVDPGRMVLTVAITRLH